MKTSDEHLVEFVFRVYTNANQSELDELMSISDEFRNGIGNREDGTAVYYNYEPTGSHWRCVNIDPAAADLPGGNRLAKPGAADVVRMLEDIGRYKDIRPVRVTMGKTTYEGAFYQDNNRANSTFYLLGDKPPSAQRSNYKFKQSTYKWFIASWSTNDAVMNRSEFHPLGSWFMMTPMIHEILSQRGFPRQTMQIKVEYLD